MCEKAGLFARALSLSTKEEDIKRILLYTKDIARVIPQKLILRSVEHLDEAAILEVLTKMINESKDNIYLAYKIAEQSVHKVKVLDLLSAFEEHWSSGNSLTFLARA